MHARGNITSHLPRRHMAAIARRLAISFDCAGVVEIFKKTPCIADSKPAGRVVAKDLYEIDGIPFLATTQLAGGEFANRRRSRTSREDKGGSGAIREAARRVGPAVSGAITHRGGAEEKQCYADM
jgi:hypothetical protein